MNTLIGFDNGNNEMAEIYLDEDGGFIGCERYDWAFDVTEQGISMIKAGDFSPLSNYADKYELWFVEV